MNIDDITAAIRNAHRPERTVELCLAGDLVAEWELLDRQRVAALRNTADSLDGGAAGEIVAQMEALRERMAAATITVRLRALPRAAYTRLLGEHGPRRDDEGQVVPEDVAGWNSETYWPAVIRASWLEPQLAPDVLDELLDEALSQRQFDELATVAHLVNRGRVDLPNLPAGSTTTRTSGTA